MLPELKIAEEAAQAAGEIAARYFDAEVVARQKDAGVSYNLVSDADVEAEHAIVDRIRRAFPDHAVLGEEAHQCDVNAEHLWIIDPIDGTNNFLHHVPQFAVSIAYYRSCEPVCGVIHNPVRGEWYVAVRGEGAFADGKRVHVADHERLDESLVGVGFYYDRGAMMEATLTAIRELFGRHIHGIRRFGAAALDLCSVGMGQLGAFFEYQLSPWDFAAGRLFVEEAGGRVTTCRGDALPLAKTSVLATNGRLHEAMLEVVSKYSSA